MARIEKVKNVAIYADLTNTPSTWNFTHNLHFTPDECIVRQITYNGPPTSDGAFLIWSSLTNDIIGSFAVSEATGFTSTCVNAKPETVIPILPNSIPQTIKFVIQSVNGSSNVVTSTNLTGTIIINIDFIKYK
jgi:hypothetical protein